MTSPARQRREWLDSAKPLIAEVFRRLHEEKGLRNYQISEQTGIPAYILSKFFRQTDYPTYQEMTKLLVLAEMTPNEGAAFLKLFREEQVMQDARTAIERRLLERWRNMERSSAPDPEEIQDAVLTLFKAATSVEDAQPYGSSQGVAATDGRKRSQV